MDKLGIEPSLLIAQVVNFLIILIALKVLLYKPILSMLEKRKKKIEEGLKLTETMKEEEAKLEVKKEKVIADARKDAQSVIEEARGRGKEQEKEIIGEAKKEAEAIIEKAKLAAIKERESMQEALEREAVQLALAMAKKLLGESLTKDAQKTILEKHIRDIAKL